MSPGNGRLCVLFPCLWICEGHGTFIRLPRLFGIGQRDGNHGGISSVPVHRWIQLDPYESLTTIIHASCHRSNYCRYIPTRQRKDAWSGPVHRSLAHRSRPRHHRSWVRRVQRLEKILLLARRPMRSGHPDGVDSPSRHPSGPHQLLGSNRLDRELPRLRRGSFAALCAEYGPWRREGMGNTT